MRTRAPIGRLVSSISSTVILAMTVNDPENDQAYLLVGKFVFLWNALEYRITNGIKTLLDLEKAQADIVLANVAFRDKTSMLGVLAEVALRPSDPKAADKARSLLTSITEFSANYRNVLAHNPFIANGTDGIELFRIKAKKKYEIPKTVWDKEFFEARFAEISSFAAQIKNLTSDLKHKETTAKIAKLLAGSPMTRIPSLASLGLLNHPPPANTGSSPPQTTQEKSVRSQTEPQAKP